MWLKRFSTYLLQHTWQTVALAFAVTFVPIVGGIVGIIIATFITLCKGALEGALVTLACTLPLPYLINLFVTGADPRTLQLVFWVTVGISVISNLLTYTFAVLLRKQNNWALILQIGALIGVLAVSVVHLIYPDVAGWWGDQLQYYYNQVQQSLANMPNVKPEGANEAQLEAISVTKQFVTGIMIATALVNAFVQLIVARWWQASLFARGILRKELHNIRLSQLAGVLFMVSLVLSYLGNSVVLDIMPILYLLFAAAGLSLAHYLFGLRQSTTVWFWLSVFYVAVIISMPMSLVLLSFFALLDVWLDIRKRLKKVD